MLVITVNLATFITEKYIEETIGELAFQFLQCYIYWVGSKVCGIWFHSTCYWNLTFQWVFSYDSWVDWEF